MVVEAFLKVLVRFLGCLGVSWGGLGGVLGCLGRVLGGSWGGLGTKACRKHPGLTPRGPGFAGLLRPRWSKLDPSWDQKPLRILSGGLLKSDHIFDWLWGRVLLPFGANLGPTWPPKPSQNRPKLASKSIKICIKMLTTFFLDFYSVWGRFFVNFASKLEGRGTKKH